MPICIERCRTACSFCRQPSCILAKQKGDICIGYITCKTYKKAIYCLKTVGASFSIAPTTLRFLFCSPWRPLHNQHGTSYHLVGFNGFRLCGLWSPFLWSKTAPRKPFCMHMGIRIEAGSVQSPTDEPVADTRSIQCFSHR
jgi:hypothetical protein